MSANVVLPKPMTPPRAAAQGRAQPLDRFALALPAVMAFLLVLPPLIGPAARAPFLLVLVPLAVWTAFTNTERALYVYCAWCWMDGSIRGVFASAPVAIVARDLVLLLIVAGWAARRLRTRERDPVRVPPGTFLVVLFVINCLLQIGNPASLGLLQSLAGLKLHLSTLPLLFVGFDVFRRSHQARSLMLFLTLATLVISAVSVVQYLHGPAWTYAHFPGSEQVISQEAGLLGSAAQESQVAGFKPPGTTTFGGGTNSYVGLVLPLTFALVLLSRRQRFGAAARMVLGGVIFAFIVTLFLNSVRSGLVSGVFGVLACSLLAGGRQRARALRLCLICLALGAAGWTFSIGLSNGHVANRFGSTFANPVQALHSDRATFFDQFGSLVTTTPLGVGLGRVGAAAGRFVSGKEAASGAVFSEAYLGNLMAETGILGALLMFCLALLFLWRGFRALQSVSDEDDRLVGTALLAVLLVIFANFFASPILIGPPGSVLFWLFAAILLRVYGQPGAARVVSKEPV